MSSHLSLVPNLHLGTRLSAQLCCSATVLPSEIGNGVGSASAFPNGDWERGIKNFPAFS